MSINRQIANVSRARRLTKTETPRLKQRSQMLTNIQMQLSFMGALPRWLYSVPCSDAETTNQEASHFQMGLHLSQRYITPLFHRKPDTMQTKPAKNFMSNK